MLKGICFKDGDSIVKTGLLLYWFRRSFGECVLDALSPFDRLRTNGLTTKSSLALLFLRRELNTKNKIAAVTEKVPSQ